MRVDIRLNQEILNRMGTDSLLGMVLNQVDSKDLGPDLEVCLQFEQTTAYWRETHGGPDSWALVEYAPWCLVAGVLRLTRMGVRVDTEGVSVPQSK